MASIERRLNLALLVLIEGHPVWIPKLYSVVRSGGVGCRDDRPARECTGSSGQGRRRDESRFDRGPARGGASRGERLDEHRRRDYWISADTPACVRFSEEP